MDWTAIEALPAAFAALREAVQGVRSRPQTGQCGRESRLPTR